jgi:hypothetical protein
VAFNRSYIQPEDDYALKVIAYFNDIRTTPDDEERLSKIALGEGFLNNILEGSEYYDSKKRLQAKIAEDQKNNKKYSVLAYGVALIKLQQRASKDANIFGKKGLTIISPRQGEEKAVEEAIKNEEAGREDVT